MRHRFLTFILLLTLVLFNSASLRASLYQTEALGLPDQSLAYDENDWINNAALNFAFDDNGNTVSANGVTYQYDFENRLIKRTGSGVPEITYLYDGNGNRVRKTVTENGVTTVTQYLIHNLNPTGYAQVLEELHGADAATAPVSAKLVYGLHRLTQTSSGGTYTFLYDGHGSTRALVTSGGTIAQAYNYDAFGNLVGFTGTLLTPYLYTGEYFDADLKMYYLRARWYSTDLGRFWTSDSFEGILNDPLSHHKFLYCAHNPVMMVDPSGHMFSLIESFAVNVGNVFQKNSEAVRGHFVKAKIRSQIKDILEDQAIEGIYVIIVEPQLGVLTPYVGQGKNLQGRLPQSVLRFMEELTDGAIRYIGYLPIDTTGVSGERARKFVRETAEQYLLNLLSIENPETLNRIDPVSSENAGGRFKKHFKKITKEWFKELFDRMQKSRIP